MVPTYILNDVEMRYGERIALCIERLELAPGRVHALLGPNGSGKSTLLQLLALLSPPAAGRLEFDGEPVRWSGSSLRLLRSRVTLVHQNPYLFDRTVYRNVALGLAARGLRGMEQRAAVAGALEAVGLQGFGERRARELSGGEAQRVALARALALNPDVLLLDEPTSGCSRETCLQIEEVVRGLIRQGRTVVLSTHDAEQALRLESRMLWLAEGRLLAPPVRGERRSGCPERFRGKIREQNSPSIKGFSVLGGDF